MKQLLFSVSVFVFCSGMFAQNVLQKLPESSSIRGMSVVSADEVWFSGSKGYVGCTRDLGNTFYMEQVPGYETAELRDIHVFEDGSICVMSSTLPAAILRSVDTGKTWSTVFREDSAWWFLDAFDFYGDQGICIGDPIDGHFVLLHTSDAGKTWSKQFVEERTDSLAAFAASGSTIRYVDKKRVLFATGGAEAKIFMSRDRGQTWTSYPTRVLHGTPSSGIFCLEVMDDGWIIAGGGDYTGATSGISLFTFQIGKRTLFKHGADAFSDTEINFFPTCLSYISSIAYVNDTTAVICGTGGHMQFDMQECTYPSTTGFNVCAASPDKSYVFLAGDSRFGMIDLRFAGLRVE